MTHQVRFDLQENTLTISSEDIEGGGEGREVLTVEYVGAPLKIGYNANYLIEILRHIDTDLARFELRDPVSAAIIRPTEHRENEEFIALVMPIRLTEE
jgi:DNA polymerase-3 subunit beta